MSNKRVVNKKFYQEVRDRDKFCLIGLARKDGCYGPIAVHHIIYRSQGGGDVPDNGICLCQKHHQMVHAGKISVDELREAKEMFTFQEWEY